MCITKQQFDDLKLIEATPLLRIDDFSAEEFNRLAESARTLVDQGFLSSPDKDPFHKPSTSTNGYDMLGRFELLDKAKHIIQFNTFKDYQKSIPKPKIWNIDRRLALWAIVIGLLSIIASMFLKFW